ncbi:uncharacterized protein LOC144634278 [Oculina patagonica]
MMFKLTVLSLFGRQSPVSSHLSLKILPCFLAKSTIRSYATSWQLVQKRVSPLAADQSSIKIPFVLKSTAVSGEIKLDPYHKTSIMALLEVFDETLSIASMVYLLGWMGRIAKKDCTIQEKLHMKSSNKGASVYIRLLNCITNNISTVEPRQLAVIVWSLAKIQERNHPLLQVCEKEILSRGVGTFDYKTVSQVAVGCSLLNWTETSVFSEMEKAILSGQLDITTFDLRAFAQTVVSFAKTDNGSSQLFELFLNVILSCEFSTFHNNDLSHFVWSFAKRGFQADQLFEKTETELFRRNISAIKKSVDIAMLLWSFASTGNGSKDLFRAFEELIQSKNIKHFENNELSQIIWALGKAGVPSDKVLTKFEQEVKRRGIQTFSRDDNEMPHKGFRVASGANKKLLSTCSGNTSQMFR